MANGFLSVAGPQPRDLSPLARSLAAVVAATFRSAMRLITPFFFAALVTTVSSFQAAEPIRDRLSFPEPPHRWRQVDATFPDVTQTKVGPRIGRPSPARYFVPDL